MKQQFLLLDSFEAIGDWWHPEHPEHKVTGTLEYSPDTGVVLNIVGSLLPDRLNIGPFRSYDTVFGHLLNGPICTLVSSITTNRTIRSGAGVVGERIASEYLLLNIHHDHFKEHKYSLLSVQFTNLAWWLGKQPIARSWTSEEDHRAHVEYDLFTTSFQHHINSRDCELSIIQLVSEQVSMRSMTVEVSDHVVIEASQPQTFDWYWQLMGDIRNLLVLFLTFPIYALKVAMMTIKCSQALLTWDLEMSPPSSTIRVPFKPKFVSILTGLVYLTRVTRRCFSMVWLH